MTALAAGCRSQESPPGTRGQAFTSATSTATTTVPFADAATSAVPAAPPAPPIPAQVALAVVDLSTGTSLFEQRADVLQRPTHPGSISKVFTLLAALNAAEVDASTRIPCRERHVVGGRVLTCSHPRLGHALSASEALAHSCNGFFVTVAQRTTWPRIAAELRRAGLPAEPEPRDVALGAVGLEGPKFAPRELLAAFARVVQEARSRDGPSDRIVLAGLRAAGRDGSARAFGEQGLDVLAKTGSGRIVGGAPGGLVVALHPADAPRHGVVVIGAGMAGRDAAGIAAAALRRAVPELATPAAPTARGAASAETVRLGTIVGDGVRVSDIGLEDYVAGVVAAEAPPTASHPLREALAIAARSYALANRGRHADEGYDLCNLTHCQVHRGADDASVKAAQATAGLVLRYRGRILPAFHSASCGGSLESPGVLWTGASALDAVMPARADPVAHDPGAWRSDVTAADLLSAVRAAGLRGDELRGLGVTAQRPSGRVRELRVDGLAPERIDGESFRRAVGRTLGWQVLKSTLFSVTPTARGYRFDGRGHGHGVGLCVAGAEQLAARGRSARDILATYFPGSTVDAQGDGVSPARVRVLLPATDEADRAMVEGLVERAVSDLERRLSVRRPADLVVRFHPTVQSYVRAGGPGWWTGGTTRGSRVELTPLSVLRERGLLERTVRHELVHALTYTALQGRPRWVSEGIAALMQHPQAPQGPIPAANAEHVATCPDDAAFDAARSATALADLYERASACVGRAIAAAGGDWRRAQWEEPVR